MVRIPLINRERKGKFFAIRRNQRRKSKPRKRRLKGRVLGEGFQGRVIERNPWVVRKQYIKYPLKNVRRAARQESKIQKRVSRLGLAPKVISVGDDYVDMQYVRGTPLKSKLATASDRRQRRLGKKLGRKLKKLHDAGIAHRDLHLDNVLVTGMGSMKIIDYGWAKDYGKRPLTMRERRKDYRKLTRKYAKGRQYQPFREGFVATYTP